MTLSDGIERKPFIVMKKELYSMLLKPQYALVTIKRGYNEHGFDEQTVVLNKFCWSHAARYNRVLLYYVIGIRKTNCISAICYHLVKLPKILKRNSKVKKA